MTDLLKNPLTVAAVRKWRKLNLWRRVLIVEVLRELEDVKQEAWEMDQTLALQRRRDAEAVKRWRAEDPKRRLLVHPDLGDLLAWLMGQADHWQNVACAVAFDRGWQIGLQARSDAEASQELVKDYMHFSMVEKNTRQAERQAMHDQMLVLFPKGDPLREEVMRRMQTLLVQRAAKRLGAPDVETAIPLGQGGEGEPR